MYFIGKQIQLLLYHNAMKWKVQKLLRIRTNLVDKYEINFNEIMKFSAAYSESLQNILESSQ